MASGPFAGAQSESINRTLFELVTRLERQESEIRRLRGDIEVYQYRQRQLAARLEALERQLAASSPGGGGDGGLGAPSRPTAVAPPRVSPTLETETETETEFEFEPHDASFEADPDAILGEVGDDFDAAPSPTPEAGRGESGPRPPRLASLPRDDARIQGDFDDALGQLRRGDHRGAIAAFEDFLANYPQSDLAAEALFWLGEAHYIDRDFPRAEGIFIDLGRRHPTSQRIPDTLLRLGFIYEVEGDMAQARAVYDELLRRYPQSRAANQAARRRGQLP